jgi:secondary thiamine-phosphate synthase enzyme
MPVFQKSFHVQTQGRCDVLDITTEVNQLISESRVKRGLANIAGRGSTLGITTLEFEPGCVADLKRALEQIAPTNTDYAHNDRWGDENGYAHLRSALVGTTKSFPVTGGQLYLGRWEQLVLCDFDDRPREREVIVTIFGE